MSYTKTTWQNGDTITAEKLNHIENGIADAGSGGGEAIVINLTWDSDSEQYIYEGDLTVGEIRNAYISGVPIICVEPQNSAHPEDPNNGTIGALRDIDTAININGANAYIHYGYNGMIETANYVDCTIEGLDALVIGTIIDS